MSSIRIYQNLPNIWFTEGNATSGYGLNWTGGIIAAGAMFVSKAASCLLGGSGNAYGTVATEVTFSCEFQNPIYSGENVVRPNSLTVVICIRC